MRSRRSGWVAALLLLVACTSSGRSRGELAGAPGPASQNPAVSAAEPQGSWRVIAPAPIPPASGMAAVWTGRQLVAWGGSAGGGLDQDDEDTGAGSWHPSGAGAAYDPGADRWEVLPPAPVAARVGASAVWSGREVLIWGGAAGHDTFFADGAAYDPATRKWRVLPPAPIGARSDHQAVWTGKEMLVWGGIRQCCPIDSEIHDPAAAAYDPTTNRWRRVADVPGPWSGDDGTAVTVADGDRPLIWRRGHLGAADAGLASWAEVPGVQPPPLPADPSTATTPATTGDPVAMGTAAGGEVFTWTGRSGELHGLAWRPSDATWRRTATLDAQGGGRVVAGEP